jgi:hypothetical protein
MAALSGPASTMMVLRGEALADLVTNGPFSASETHGAEDAFKTLKRMVGSSRAALKKVVAVLAFDDHDVATIRCLACFAEISLEFREAHFHGNLII